MADTTATTAVWTPAITTGRRDWNSLIYGAYTTSAPTVVRNYRGTDHVMQWLDDFTVNEADKLRDELAEVEQRLREELDRRHMPSGPVCYMSYEDDEPTERPGRDDGGEPGERPCVTDTAKVITDKTEAGSATELKWISVKDRMPDGVFPCLVYDGEDITVGYWDAENNAWDSPNFGWIEHRMRKDSYPFGVNDITHWMPATFLPDIQ